MKVIDLFNVTRFPIVYQYIRSGLYEAVELLIRKGASINSLNKNNDSALTLAAEMGHEKIIQLLVDKKAHINVVNGCGNTPLILGNFFIVVSTNGMLRTDNPLLTNFSCCFDVDSQFSVARKGNLHSFNEKKVVNNIKISLLPILGLEQFVNLFVELGSDINRTNRCGNNALIFSTIRG